MNLPCMNCKKEVEEGQGKFFAQVYVCPSCHEQAQHFHNRLVRELNFLLVMAKESIRLALVQSKFSFPEGPAGEPSKEQVLKEILLMEERRDRLAREQATCTASTGSTKPNAPTPDLLSAADDASLHKHSPRG